MRDFLDLIKPDPEPISREDLIEYVRRLWIGSNYSPNRGVLDTLIASGKIGLIQNDEITTKLNAWSAALVVYNDRLRRRDINVERYKATLEKHYSFRDALLASRDWMRPPSPSNFEHDHQALLSMPELENAAEFSRVNFVGMADNLEIIESLQSEVINLIDGELSSSP